MHSSSSSRLVDAKELVHDPVCTEHFWSPGNRARLRSAKFAATLYDLSQLLFIWLGLLAANKHKNCNEEVMWIYLSLVILSSDLTVETLMLDAGRVKHSSCQIINLQYELIRQKQIVVARVWVQMSRMSFVGMLMTTWEQYVRIACLASLV